MSVLGGMTLQYSKEKSLLNSPVGKEVAGIKWAQCSGHGVGYSLCRWSSLSGWLLPPAVRCGAEYVEVL